MRVTRRVKLGVGVVSGGLLLAIGAGVATAGGGGGTEDADASAPAAEADVEGARRERATSTAFTTTTTSTASPTTTAAPVAPATTAALEGTESPPATRPRAPAPPITALPPPPMPTVTPWVDTRPEAIDWSASCRTTGHTSVEGTARVAWSDGFVDEFSVTVTTPVYNQSFSGGQRGWWITLTVWAPPDGAIGDFTCPTATTGGPARWNG